MIQKEGRMRKWVEGEREMQVLTLNLLEGNANSAVLLDQFLV